MWLSQEGIEYFGHPDARGGAGAGHRLGELCAAGTYAPVARCAGGGFCRWDQRALAGSCIHRGVHLLTVPKRSESASLRGVGFSLFVMISEVFMKGMRENPVNDKNSSGGSCFISNSGLP